MIRRIALCDLYLLTYDITQAAHSFELLQQEVLEKCYPFLYDNGFNTERQIAIQVCKSRSISQGVVTGFSIVGWERNCREWRRDARCTMHLHTSSPDWKGSYFDLTANALDEDAIPLTLSDIEPSYQQDLADMKALKGVLQHIRGHADTVF